MQKRERNLKERQRDDFYETLTESGYEGEYDRPVISALAAAGLLAVGLLILFLILI